MGNVKNYKVFDHSQYPFIEADQFIEIEFYEKTTIAGYLESNTGGILSLVKCSKAKEFQSEKYSHLCYDDQIHLFKQSGVIICIDITDEDVKQIASYEY